jgi:uncharacterized membrane protein
MDKDLRNKQVNKVGRTKTVVTVASILIMLVIALMIYKNQSSEDKDNNSGNTNPVVKDSDIIIPINEITETASFYPAEINGTSLEVLAVKAPDGSIRTAFNTCQVCYSSGKGYYVQEGEFLICQNCGNRFSMDDVEITRGGCNPVPITEEYKTADSDKITISKDFLAEATVIFSNWKK